MKVCKYCGTQFEGNFCPRCGAPACDDDFVNGDAGDVGIPGIPHAVQDGKPRSVSKRRILAVVLPVVIVLIVALALIFAFSVGSCAGKSGDETDIPQTAAPGTDSEATDSGFESDGTSDAGGVSETYEGLSYTKKGSTYEVSYAGDGTETEIVVPSSFNGVSVTSIGSSAFSGCSTLESIAVPDSVTSVGDYAFKGCKSLTEITIPQSVKSIGSGAFSGCSSLESMTLPFVGESSSATSASKTTLFGYVFGTSSYTGGVSTKQYYSYSSSCTYYIPSSLKSVTVTGGKILYGSFYNCANITCVSVTGSVSSLDNYIFEGCTSIKEIYYGVSSSDGASSSSYAFSGAGKQDPGITVTIGADAPAIPSSLFYNCANITEVVFEESSSCGSIGTSAFYGCSGLTAINLPDTVTSIGGSAFRGCSSLCSVTIPRSVTDLGTYAFYGCTALTEIRYEAPSLSDFASSGNVFTDAGRYAAGLTVTIGTGVTAIPAYLFYGSSYITAVVFEDGAVCGAVGNSAFYGCSSLESIELPDTVTAVGTSAFRNCTSLLSVVIPEGVTEIGSNTFYNCSSLTDIVIPGSVTSIASGAFCGCSSLESMTIPFVGGDAGASEVSSSTLFGYIFGTTSYTGGSAVSQRYGNSSYATYYIPSSLKSITVSGGEILYGSFYNCSKIEKVTIGDDVTSIGSYAFHECTSLTTITIGAGVTSISSYAFYYCTALEEIYYNAVAAQNLSQDNHAFDYAGRLGAGITVTIGEEVTKIPAFLFCPYSSINASYAPQITSVIFNGVSSCSIGSDAFYYCVYLSRVYVSDLETWCSITFGNAYANPMAYASELYVDGELARELVIPDTVTDIPNYAFYNCDNIVSVMIGNNATSVGNYSFYDCDGIVAVTMGEEVASVGNSAFYDCDNLLCVTLPKNITLIGTNAFYGCEKLVQIINPSSLNLTIGLDNYGYMAYYAVCVCAQEDEGGTFRATDDGYIFYEYDGKVYLMAYTGSETALTLPDDPWGEGYEIYKYMFYARTGLVCVTIGGSVTSIGTYSFYNCSSLVSLTMSEGLESIGSYAFYGCKALEEVTIPDSVTSVGQYAFYNCSSIGSLTIGGAVTSVGTYAFYGCTGLTEINFNAVEMNDLSSGNYVFYNAGRSGSGITVTIGTEVTKIPAYLFYPYNSSSYVPKVTAVVFEEGSKCTTIGSYAFYYCSNLISVLMPGSVTTVNGNAFGNCTSLSMIYYTGTAEEWDEIYIVTSGNTYIINCTIYYYSETQPAENGNCWYYDDDGNPAIWRRT